MTNQPMTFTDSSDVTELRARLRRMIEQDLPEDFRGAWVEGDAGQRVANEFCRRLASEGLLTMSWPREFGGAGASVWEQTALREEMWAHHEPRGAQYMGLNWVGPSIMEFGTEAQRGEHLPAIAHGDSVWCQGFSEPGAGSDLASLQLSGARAGDGEWRLDGQKIWTSYASLAQWCFLAARTDPAASKRQGITIFLIPMDRPGVTVRQIDSMLGPHHLNEVYFDDVRATDAEILGELNRGWDVINFVLRHERIGIARYARSERILFLLAEYLPDDDSVEASALRVAHARLLTKARAARLMNYRSVGSPAAAAAGGVSGARLASTLLDQEVAELALEILGEDGLSDEDGVPLDGWAEDAFRYARSSTIASGTSEIQRMLVARAMTAGGR
jgi:alkylation response protein AidB-like acyl-CoA dehydrogenase